jgi:hypothetical protein
MEFQVTDVADLRLHKPHGGSATPPLGRGQVDGDRARSWLTDDVTNALVVAPSWSAIPWAAMGEYVPAWAATD